MAAVFVDVKDAKLQRRVVLWQDDQGELVVTEWDAGGKSQYRLVDKLGPSALPPPKHGTPLAAVASDKGIVHVVFLDAEHVLTHVFEASPGEWTEGRVDPAAARIAASMGSPLSATWHQSKQGVKFLVVAYVTAEGRIRLALASDPDGDAKWETFPAAPLAHTVTGQTISTSLAVTGDGTDPSAKATPIIYMALEDDTGLSGYECVTDHWQSPPVEMRCSQTQRTEQGELPSRGELQHILTLFPDGMDIPTTQSPPPRQITWIRLGDKAGYILLALSTDGAILERRIAPGKSREKGRGIRGDVEFRAIGATDEGYVFAASKENVYIYRREQKSGDWIAQGRLL